MCVDPLAEKYPYNSTYAFQENKMGMGRELEGLELAPRNPTASFGGWISSKYNSAVSSFQTGTSNVMQAISSVISNAEIKPVDGYQIGGVTVGKNGIGGTPGLFNPSPGVTSSGTIDGDFLQGLAVAYAPNLGGSKVMNGANIFSNLAQDPTLNNVFETLSNNSSVSNTNNTSNNAEGEKITMKLENYSATGTAGWNKSTLFRDPSPNDTTVNKSQKSVIDKMNKLNHMKAEQNVKSENQELQKKIDYYK
ncbi:hypothetical protein [Flavobacterium chilense]|uniref:Uncharacterized protein n=1 Tax=Flavobacterium chilense TaxID=946677 RepID=A0A1M6XAJ3_9FLAO|nr:hypothetical protein [Flavobacterium chilense]SHL02966.1 hypothetical protein SAMN05444484_10163 [Flavobacterium chilense]